MDVLTFDLTEIINGEETMGPSPFRKHQKILNKINIMLSFYIENKDIGEVFISPLDVILEENINRLQPDLIFIKKENLVIAQDWIRGVPDAVFEVVSEGSVTRDIIIKKDIYKKYKVPEYWIIIPDLNTVEVFIIENNEYKLFSYAEVTGIVKSKIIDGFEINIEKIFK
jgi:Uma2 family endonuclease